MLALLAVLLCTDTIKSLNHTRGKTWQRPLDQCGFGHQPYRIEIEKKKESRMKEKPHQKTVTAITIVIATNSYIRIIKITTENKHSTVCVHEPFPHIEKIIGIFDSNFNHFDQRKIPRNLCSQHLNEPEKSNQVDVSRIIRSCLTRRWAFSSELLPFLEVDFQHDSRHC